MVPLMEVAAKYGLVIVEDAAGRWARPGDGHTCGTRFEAIPPYSASSWQQSRHHRRGGMILTNDDDHAKARAAFYFYGKEVACLVVRP